MIELRTLGGLELTTSENASAASVLAQPRRAALLCYLALAEPRGFHRRDVLFALFWPECDADQARHALRQSVYILRRALGTKAIMSRGDEELSLSPDQVCCDAWTFDTALDQGRAAEALALYRGELLAGFHISAAPEFEHWLDEERARLRERAAEAAWALATVRERAGDAAGAAEAARRAAGLSPADETALRRLMLLLERVGDRAAAVHAYEAFVSKLEREYELEPSTETRALMARIRAEPGESRAPASAHDIGLSPATADGHFEPALAAQAPARPGRSRFGLLAAGLGTIAALGLATDLVRSRPDAPPATEPDLLAIAPFETRTRQFETWSEGMVDVLSRSLDGAGALRTVSPSVALKGWTGRADRASALALARRTGAGLVLFGSLERSGADSVRVRAAVLEVGPGEAPAEVEVTGDTLRMDRVVDSLTVAVLRELGRTRPVRAVRQSPVGAASLPALKAFLRGEQFYRHGPWDSALAQYDRAIELDSTFALAYRRMWMVVGWNSGAAARYQPLDEYVRGAAVFNHGLAPRDSLLILADSLGVLGMDIGDPHYFENRRRQFVALREAQRRYPGDPEVWFALGEAMVHANEPVLATQAEALDAFDRAIALDSGFAPAYFHAPSLALAVDLGDPGRARRYLAGYLRLDPQDDNARRLRLVARLLDPRQASLPETARLIDAASAHELISAGVEYLGSWPDSAETAVRLLRNLAFRPHGVVPANPWLSDSVVRRRILAFALMQRGHLQEAYELSSGFGPPWPSPYAQLALWGVVAGDTAASVFRRAMNRDFANHAIRLIAVLPWWSVHRDTTALSRFAWRLDSIARSDSARPAKSAMWRYGRSAARAYLMLARGDSAAALRVFSSLPDSVCGVFFWFSCRPQKLTEARLLEAVGEDMRAARLLERFAGSQLFSGGLEPLAVLERARIAERLGDRETAISAYRFVVDVWRHADPELLAFVEEAQRGLGRVMGGSSGGGW